MRYKEYEIGQSLRPYVKVIWSLESDTTILNGTPIHILPDTCVELVIHFSDPYKTTFSDGSVSIQGQSLVVGQMKGFMKVCAHGRTGFIAVRFTALGAYHFFGLPMKEMANGETALRDVWDGMASEIESKIFDAASTQHRATIIQNYLELQLFRNGEIDKTVEFCVNEIMLTNGNLNMERLARKAGISNRQLVRRFDKCIGLSPKEFARTTKFISSLNLLDCSRNLTLTEVSHATGYFDQAHFIHDFKELSGLTPTEYLNSTNIVY